MFDAFVSIVCSCKDFGYLTNSKDRLENLTCLILKKIKDKRVSNWANAKIGWGFLHEGERDAHHEP